MSLTIPHPKNKKAKKIYSAPVTDFLKPISPNLDLPNIEKLDYELLDFYSHILPHRKEVNFRYFLYMKIKQHVYSMFPNATVEFFGSSACDLYLPSSDIDCVIFSGEDEDTTVLNTLSKTLRRAWFLDPSFVLYLRKAKVPVIKCKDKVNKLGIDFIVNNKSSIEQTNFVNKSIAESPIIRPICLLLKYFLKSRNLHDSSSGGLCSYALFLMIHSFIHLHPILQQNFNAGIKSLGTTMMDFFQYYGFDFPYEGVTINVLDKCYESQKISNAIISIEDPVNKGFDVGRNCTKMYVIRDVFRHAYTVMDMALKSEPDKGVSLCGLWIKMSYEEESLRKKIIEFERRKNYRTNRNNDRGQRRS